VTRAIDSLREPEKGDSNSHVGLELLKEKENSARQRDGSADVTDKKSPPREKRDITDL